MDNLPLGPMLAVIALLVLWAALFTAIEAAQQHLLALRPGTRQGDKAAARLNFPRHSMILCNTLCRAGVDPLYPAGDLRLGAKRRVAWLAGLLQHPAGAGRLPTPRPGHPPSGSGAGLRQCPAGRAAENPLSPRLAAQWHQPAVATPLCTHARRSEKKRRPAARP